jgi:hypothetical protein
VPHPGPMDDPDSVLDVAGRLCPTSYFSSISKRIVILKVEIFAGEVERFVSGLRVFSSIGRTLTWVGGTASPVTTPETAGTSQVKSDPIGNPTR